MICFWIELSSFLHPPSSFIHIPIWNAFEVSSLFYPPTLYIYTYHHENIHRNVKSNFKTFCEFRWHFFFFFWKTLKMKNEKCIKHATMRWWRLETQRCAIPYFYIDIHGKRILLLLLNCCINNWNKIHPWFTQIYPHHVHVYSLIPSRSESLYIFYVRQHFHFKTKNKNSFFLIFFCVSLLRCYC